MQIKQATSMILMVVTASCCFPGYSQVEQSAPSLISQGVLSAQSGDRAAVLKIMDKLYNLKDADFTAIKEFTDQPVVTKLLIGSNEAVDVPFNWVKVTKMPESLTYPPAAKLARIQGAVLVELLVDLDGRPLRAIALEGPEELRQSACAFGLRWRLQANKKLASGFFKTRTPVLFRLK